MTRDKCSACRRTFSFVRVLFVFGVGAVLCVQLGVEFQLGEGYTVPLNSAVTLAIGGQIEKRERSLFSLWFLLLLIGYENGVE